MSRLVMDEEWMRSGQWLGSV